VVSGQWLVTTDNGQRTTDKKTRVYKDVDEVGDKKPLIQAD
jgi:hypothetical protein